MNLFARCSHNIFLSAFLLMALATSAFAKTEIVNAIQEAPGLTANDLKAPSTPSKSNDPLTGFGHGKFFGKNGEVFDPTPQSAYEVQTYYLTKITSTFDPVKDRKALATLSVLTPALLLSCRLDLSVSRYPAV